jgi:hypothetical protein
VSIEKDSTAERAEDAENQKKKEKLGDLCDLRGEKRDSTTLERRIIKS